MHCFCVISVCISSSSSFLLARLLPLEVVVDQPHSPTNTSRVFYNKKARKKSRRRQREKEERKKERREGKRKKEEAVIKLICFESTRRRSGDWGLGVFRFN